MNLSEDLDAGLILFAYNVFSDPTMARSQPRSSPGFSCLLQIYFFTGVQIRQWDQRYEEYPEAPQKLKDVFSRFLVHSMTILITTLDISHSL